MFPILLNLLNSKITHTQRTDEVRVKRSIGCHQFQLIPFMDNKLGSVFNVLVYVLKQSVFIHYLFGPLCLWFRVFSWSGYWLKF